jgi:hypothetical protein
MNKLIINRAAARTITMGASGNTGHIIISLKDYKNELKLN